MLYEIALPALVLSDCCRWLRDAVRLPGHARTRVQAARFRFRAAKCKLRRTELALLADLAPDRAAQLALARFERTQPAQTGTARPLASSATAWLGRLPACLLGPVDGPTLLLVHGWNATGAMLLPLAEAMAARGFRVVLPDLPFAGRRPGEGFIGAARALAEACAGHAAFAVVAGHSAGGLIAAMAAGEGLAAQRLISISAPASMATLLGAYLARTQAPRRLLPAVLRAAQARSGRDPAQIGPQDYARFADCHLVVHARNDWQVRLDEAFAICTARPDFAQARHRPVILEHCNHHGILRAPALHAAIAAFAQDEPVAC